MIPARVLLWALLAFLVFGALAFAAVVAVVVHWFAPKRKAREVEPVRPLNRS